MGLLLLQGQDEEKSWSCQAGPAPHKTKLPNEITAHLADPAGLAAGFARNANVPAGMGFPQLILKFKSDNFKTCLSPEILFREKKQVHFKILFHPVKL